MTRRTDAPHPYGYATRTYYRAANMQYLLILYYGLHATTPGAAMLTGELPAAACTEMASVGRDASHVTTCGAGNTLSAVLALHHCTLVDVSDGPVQIRNYTCQE